MNPRPLTGDAESTGETLLGPTGRPLRIPYFDLPTWMVYAPRDAKAVGLAAWLWTFVNSQFQDFSCNVEVPDVCRRWDLSRSAVTSKARSRTRGGLVERLQQAGILQVERRVRKTRDCSGCGTAQERDCPPECTETKGRMRIAPRFAMVPTPPDGFLYPGPIDVGEYTHPDRIQTRLWQEGPQSALEPFERRQSYPYATAMSWVAHHPQVSLIDLAVYVVLCSRIAVNRGRWTTRLLRSTISRALDIGERTVSESTARLENVGAIAKAGLVRRGGQRRGSGEATRYVVMQDPPGGFLHPLALHVGEWRSPEQITARMDAVLAQRPHPLRPAHKPSDLPIVDNSASPQGGMCATCRGYVRHMQGVCAPHADRTNNPTNNPTTNLPSGGAQPQGGPQPNAGQAERGLCTDGTDTPIHESGPGAPSAAPGPQEDPLWPLVRQHVPRMMCRQGQTDQEALIARVRDLRERGYPDRDLKTVFADLRPETVTNPWAVARERMKSIPRLEEHLALVRRRQEERDSQRPAAGPGRCGVHQVAYIPEWSTPQMPYCPVCEREKAQEMAPAGFGSDANR